MEVNFTIIKVLASIGLFACCAVFGLFVLMITNRLYWNIKLCRLKHKQKHRFDKPPVAACYCRDCDKWDYDTGECSSLIGRKTKDDWFCKDAVCNINPFEEERRDLRDRLEKCLKERRKK